METMTFRQMLEKYGRSWVSITALVLVHLGACAAFFIFTWEGLWIAMMLYILMGLGVTVGFHRLFVHESFQTYAWIRWLFALLGGLSGQGHVRFWATVHRMHHKWSDQEGDPHSPIHGFWWSHFLWLTVRTPREECEKLEKKFIPDILQDPVVTRICRWTLPLHICVAALLFTSGWAYDGWTMGISWLLWGFFLRIAVMFHMSWCVNSITHLWGYRTYPTRDTSRNNPLVALPGFGEWHNNHHGKPRAANHGRRWWELDPGYRFIRILQLLGLAWNIEYEPACPAGRPDPS